MNLKQKKVAEKLRKVLIAVGEAGLTGGVYDGNFCVWPIDIEIEYDLRFFENVEDAGEILFTPGVRLDGGAGV